MAGTSGESQPTEKQKIAYHKGRYDAVEVYRLQQQVESLTKWVKVLLVVVGQSDNQPLGIAGWSLQQAERWKGGQSPDESGGPPPFP